MMSSRAIDHSCIVTCPGRQFANGVAAILTLLAGALVGDARAQVDPPAPPRITTGRLRIEGTRIISQPSSATLLGPVYLDTANDGSGRLFLAELPGRVRLFQPNGTFSTFLDVSSEVMDIGPMGLLGMAFHPGHSDPLSPGYRKFYTYHTIPTDENVTPDFTAPDTIYNHNVVTEWQTNALNSNVIDVSTRREVFREAHVGDIHHGGMLEFGPDGYLYGTIGTPPQGTPLLLYAQNKSILQGKIFRIDPLAPDSTPLSTNPISANGKYRVPADNPFVNEPGALDEIFAIGIRHVYRFSIDPVTNTLFAGEVGNSQREEVNVIPAGSNLGWPYYEGYKVGPVTPPGTLTPPHTGPLAAYTHSDGRAIVGGYVYRGSIPALQGKYIFGEFSWRDTPEDPQGYDLNRGRLLAMDPFDEEGNLKPLSEMKIEEVLFGQTSCAQRLSTGGGCSIDMTLYSFGIDDDGELYAIGKRAGVGSGAVVYRFTDAYTISEGDYNEDGIVDAADYTKWRNTLNQSVEVIGRDADGDQDGIVDEDDYEIWRQNYGNVASNWGEGTGGITVTAPEPTAILTAVLGAVIAAAYRPRRRRQIA